MSSAPITDDRATTQPRRRSSRWTRLPVVALAAAALLLPAACGRTTAAGPDLTAAGLVSVLDLGDFGGGNAPQVNYNPFSPNKLSPASYVFEPLMVTDTYSCTSRPWLATKVTYTDAKTVVFTIRDGVRWSDGKPFTADDVLFTFQLIKKVPSLDLNGAWGFLKSVTKTGPDQVAMTFSTAPATGLGKVDLVPIVPQHVWAGVKDPATFTNPDAVGTGPYRIASFNGQQVRMSRNASYWQADRVKVEELRFSKADGGGQIDQLAMARGAYDTNAMFIPSIEKSYVARDPEHNRYWFPPGAYISLAMNLTVHPFDDVAFRRAISYGIDRSEIVSKAEYGYVTPASQTGLVLPREKDWLTPGTTGDGVLPFDTGRAASMLTAAGYPVRNGKRLGKDGRPLSFTFTVEQGYNDWVQAAGFVRTGLELLGINVDIVQPTPATATEEKNTGNFQLAFGVFGGQCSMYTNFQAPLASAQTAAIGTAAATNIVRWKDPATDRLIAALGASTTVAQQKPIVAQLQKIMVDQVPLIPLWYGGQWFEYRTSNAVNWPSADTPYAGPTDSLLIVTNLQPATRADGTGSKGSS